MFEFNLIFCLKEDVFKIEADDVGPIYKVRIGHDNKGGNAGKLDYPLVTLSIQKSLKL
jgi:hypothetical protein